MDRYTSHITKFGNIILTDNEGRVQISCIPQRGFILASIKLVHPEHGDIELLYRKKDIPDKLEDGMCPVLFPIVGKLSEDSYSWDGRTFKIPMHGFAKDLPWEVVTVSSDDKSAWVTARLEDNETTRKLYDFDFCFEMTYRLTNGRLEITPKIKSSGPFSFGIHPFFNVSAPDKEGCLLKVPAKTYWEEEAVPTGRKLPCTDEPSLSKGIPLKKLDIDLAFTDIQVNRDGIYCCEYLNSHKGVCIRIDADGKIFSEVVVYSPREAPYLCIENWTSPPNALNKGWSLISPETILQTTLSIIPSAYSPSEVNVIEEINMDIMLDRKIKDGLCRCFPKDAETFSQTRAWHGSSPLFSVIVENQDVVTAHVGIVDRIIKVGNTSLRVGGIQNVFVLNDYRGKGLCDEIMAAAMKEAGRLGFDAGLLYCVPELEKVYARCGWKLLSENKIRRINEKGEETALPEKNIAMFYPLRVKKFPAGIIHLQGNDW